MNPGDQTISNEALVHLQIEQMLNQPTGYFPNPNYLLETKTDVNQWPYPRYFRGRPDSNHPFFWGREAGYQKIEPKRDIPVFEPLSEEPDTRGGCFQSACNVVYPCYYGEIKTLPKRRVFTSL
jgi:hypothetical protein